MHNKVGDKLMYCGLPPAAKRALGVDLGAPDGDKTVAVIREGAKFLRELHPGETWVCSPKGGVIVAHPDRPTVWCRQENGRVVETIFEP